MVSGDARVSIDRLKALYDATYVGFAAREVAEQIAGTVAGAVLPFAFDPDLDLIVDPGVVWHPEIFFNAARLDRSLALNTADYIAIARPRVERIIEG